MPKPTTADALTHLMVQIWEGGKCYDLTFETRQGRNAGKAYNANDMIERLFPHAFAACEQDDTDYKYTFDDGSFVIVAPTGDAITSHRDQIQDQN